MYGLDNYSIEELEDMKYEIQLKMSDFIKSLKPSHTDLTPMRMPLLPNGPTYSNVFPGRHKEYNDMQDKVREIDFEIDLREYGYNGDGITEHKFIKTYEGFMNEYYEPSDELVKPRWNGRDYKNLFDQLKAKVKEGNYFLDELGNQKPKTLKELVELLKDCDTEESNDLAYDISTLIGMMNFFGANREIELSKLN